MKLKKVTVASRSRRSVALTRLRLGVGVFGGFFMQPLLLLQLLLLPLLLLAQPIAAANKPPAAAAAQPPFEVVEMEGAL